MLSNTLDKDLKLKQDGKYSKEREEEARQWIQEVIGRELVGESFHEQLKVSCREEKGNGTALQGRHIKDFWWYLFC